MMLTMMLTMPLMSAVQKSIPYALQCCIANAHDVLTVHAAKNTNLFTHLVMCIKRPHPPQFYEIDATQLAIKLRHEPRGRHEALEADYAAQLKAKAGKRPLGFEAPEPPQKNKKFKKKYDDDDKTLCFLLGPLVPPLSHLYISVCCSYSILCCI